MIPNIVQAKITGRTDKIELEEAIIVLKKYSQKTSRLESKIIQEAIEYYLLLWEIEKLPYEPLRLMLSTKGGVDKSQYIC